LDAFERELAGLLPRLRRFARALSRDATDADDLTQIAIERALKSRSHFAEGTRLDSWMMRIMRNIWIDEVRSRVRRARTLAPEQEGLGAVAEGSSPEQAVLRRDIGNAMEALPDQQREVIALVLVDGLAYREAADILDIPIGTLTSRLTRGRQALAAMLEAA
jgi:RNA polymerase sigma-70 factor (ECF subfamily)